MTVTLGGWKEYSIKLFILHQLKIEIAYLISFSAKFPKIEKIKLNKFENRLI
jgi:hypothetical protein